MRLTRLRRQQISLLLNGRSSGSWSTGRVATLLGMRHSTYREREALPTARGEVPANVDVDTLAAVAMVLNTFPAMLLMPDEDVIEGRGVVALRATSGKTLAEVSTRDFGLWVLGLAPLPGQINGYFDTTGRVLAARPTAKTVRGVKAEPIDPWTLEDVARAAVQGLDYSPDFTTLSDVEIGLRVLSACRKVIGLVAIGQRSDLESSEDSGDDLDVSVLEALDDLSGLLEELGKRQALWTSTT